jgi:Domain of unknown function (DUF4249)
MKIVQVFILAVSMLFLVSCTKVVDIKLNNALPQLVIQGNITNEPGPYIVTISSSIPYNASNVFPGIANAIVKITDDSTGNIDVLTDELNGNYTTNTTIGKIGHTYHLQVTLGVQIFNATSTMPKYVALDSITFFTNTGFGGSTTNPLPNFQDPAEGSNYYYFKQTINKRVLPTNFVVDDRLSNGRYISIQLFNDSSYIKKFDTVQLEMRCIDKNVFNYFNQLAQLNDPNGNQSANPTNPESNITNGALGYFSAHTRQIKKTVFK